MTAVLPRLTRSERQAANRELLIDAAEATFRRDGLHAASVAGVAAWAGLTTGAVYSNFAGKEALFLAVLDRHYEERSLSLLAALDGAPSLDVLLDRVTEWFAAVLCSEPQWPLMMVEFAAHARTSDALRTALRERHQLARDALAGLLDAEAARFGVSLPDRSARIASAIFGLGHGLVVQRLLDETEDASDVFRVALRALLGLSKGEPS